MRLNQIESDKPFDKVSELFRWSVQIKAKAASRLSPFSANQIEVRFPLLNAAINSPSGVSMRGTGDCGQIIEFTVEIALFADTLEASIDEIENATLIDVTGLDGTLNLTEPQITVLTN